MKMKRVLSALLCLVMVLTMVPTVALAEETATNHSVVVNYYLDNGEVAADPWIASIAAGTSLEQVTSVPSVVGYAVDRVGAPDGVSAILSKEDQTLDLKISAISEDIVINVIYEPALVTYTVKYFQQNVDNDNYTLAATVEQTGYTRDTVSFTTADDLTTGFYVLPYEEVEIAADGSTEVEVYMDREYYLMTFDLGGGYGVEPVFARYGAAIGDIGTPTRPGYSFLGWDKGIPETMPAENTSYVAQWEAVDLAKVSVVFWGENANDENYSYLSSSELMVKPGTSLTYTSSGNVCGMEEHTHSDSCGTNCGKEAHSHTAYDAANGCYTLTCTKEDHPKHDDSCYTCAYKNHTHDTSCYANVGSTAYPGTDAPSSPANGYIARKFFSLDKVIYIAGSWYDYTGSLEVGSTATPTCHTHTDACIGCGKEIHTHGESCYTLSCTKEVHAHSADCEYACGLQEHIHSDACKITGLDSLYPSLWTKVRSDTVTVAADGSSVINVYFDRTSFTLTFHYGSNWGTTSTITDKWGANILSRYNDIKTAAGGSMWSESKYEGPYTNYFGVMPQASRTYYLYTSSGNVLNSMTYYLQDLDGVNYTQAFQTTWYGDDSGWGSDGYYSVTEEDFFEFEGFTIDTSKSAKVDDDCKDAKFYYNRNSYNLVFINGSEEVKTESIKYQASLKDHEDYEPASPPSYMEAGAYVFDGWYANPECTEAFDFTQTMPAKHVTVYAKWVSITHTVTAYKDNTMTEIVQVGGKDAQTVAHRAFATTPTTPTNGAYTFVGWFYMENGVEKAFDFKSMPITKDMEIYAKWSSKTLVSYLITYTLADGTVIAEETSGSSLGGNTKTFEAKGGEDLYETYQVGYFPETTSHSLTLVLNGDDANENGIIDANEYTFVYVQRDAVPYTVQYLDAATGEPVADEKTVSDNRYAVVTETAVNVSGYLPDAYQKRLVVNANDSTKNVIIFYYTEDAKHALVTEYHYLVDGTIETEYSHSQITGTIGEPYSATNIEDGKIDGYLFDHAEVVVSDAAAAAYTPGAEMTLGQGGLHFKFYYVPYFTVVYSNGTEDTADDREVIVPMNDDLVTPYDVTNGINPGTADASYTDGYLYGGTFSDRVYTTGYSFAAGESGLGFTPKAGETYYVWEASAKYLRPKTLNIWRQNYQAQTYDVVRLFPVTAVDREYYSNVGFAINDKDTLSTDTVYTDFTVNKVTDEGVEKTVYTASNAFKLSGYLACIKIEDFRTNAAYAKDTVFTIQPYWVTVDNVQVYGNVERSVKYIGPQADASGKQVQPGATDYDAVSLSQEIQPAAAAVPMMMSLRMMSYTEEYNAVEEETPVEPEVTTVTVTVNDNGTVSEVTAEPGDLTEMITYAGSKGNVFAGWYTDKSCTVPADLTNVQADMTVYAKYVDDAYLSVQYIANGLFNRVTSVKLISAIDADAYAETGFVISRSGEEETIVVSDYSKRVNYMNAMLLFGRGASYNAPMMSADYSVKGMSTGSQMTVTPYWVTLDGTTVYGTARTLYITRLGVIG